MNKQILESLNVVIKMLLEEQQMLLKEHMALLEQVEHLESQIKVMEIALDRDEELIRLLGKSLNFGTIRGEDISF